MVRPFRLQRAAPLFMVYETRRRLDVDVVYR
jgi:hypothetical protein